ncbi:MAG: sugar porter family MFS transporter [Fulvimonas sp.]|nr:sugar porter family MFS transporter [Fulvimonas sp.]
MNAATVPDGESKSTGHVVLIAAAAALGGFLFGFDTSVVNGTVDAVRAGFHLNAGQIGLAVSCALLGSAVGAWYAGSLADRFGRLRTMQIAAVLLGVAALGCGLVHGLWELVFWRVVAGMGVGVASVIAPAYIAEISPADIRGRLGSLQQLAIVLGIFVALLSDAWIAHVAGGAANKSWFGLEAWRWMYIVGVLPALIYGVLSIPIPESPRYLVASDRPQEARQVLREVLDLKSESALNRKVEEIEHSLRKEYKPSFKDLRGPRLGLLPVVWTGILLSVLQQFVGINVIFYYSSALWHSVGFSEADSFTITVATSIVNVLVTLVAIALVDKVGRKPLLLAGSAGMTVALALMAWCFAQATGNGNTLSLPAPWGPVALVAANVYVVCFGVSWGPVVWVLLGEMFPNRIRAIALAVAAAAQWLANFAVSSTFPALAELGLSFAYGLYAAFALISLFFVWRAVRETKGVELEAMPE